MTDLSPGALFGAYRIEGVMGRGPSGTAYRAGATSGGKSVTLKIFHDSLDEATLARFEDDTRRLIGLSHPNILRVESVGRDGGRRFVVAEPFDGRPLRDGGLRPLREACEIVLKTARALGAAWMRLILHRNLKPENILVSASGEVKVTDFGLSQEPTPYWSPERRAGQSADMRSEIYSLGTIFREILAEPHAEIDALIHHMTRKESFERIQMVEDVVSRLESFLSRTTAPAVVAPPPPQPPPVRPPDPVMPLMPAIPTAPPIPTFSSLEAQFETGELREARAMLVGTLGAVTKRIQRSMADRMLHADARPKPPPPPPPRTVPPPAPPPRTEPPQELHLPPILASTEPLPKKRGCAVAPILGTILVIGVISALAVYKVNARLARDRAIEQQTRERLQDRVAEAVKKREEEMKAKPPPKPAPAAEPSKGKADADWTRTKAAIRALEEEMRYAEAADMCSRFVSRHGAQAPAESRTAQTELRSWSSLVQEAERFRKTSQGTPSLTILNRGGEGRAKDRERILARWCEEDWKETAAAVDKALGQSDPYTAREELLRFLKLPHQGGAHKQEAEVRKLGLQAEFDFRDVSDKTDSLLRSNKNDEAIAAWEAFLAQPHKGGSRRDEVQKRITKIREDVRRTIYAGRGTVNRLAVSPDGKRIAFTADRIRVHDVESRAEVWSQQATSLMRTMSFGGDSLLVAAFSGKITVWDIARKTELRSLKVADGFVTAMGVSRDGTRVIAVRSDGSLLTWEGDAEAAKVEKDAAPLVTVMALSPDGTKAAMGGLRDKSIRVRDLAAGQEKKWAVPAGVSVLAWSPDGKRLASVSSETVTVWDAEKGEQLHALTGHKGTVNCVAFSSDGTRVASGGSDRMVRVWNAKDGSAAATFSGHQDRVTGLVAVPGGNLVSGGADGTVRLWSLPE